MREHFIRLSRDRIDHRQIDELIGLARGMVADGEINQAEAECLQAWLAVNHEFSDQPLIAKLYDRVAEMLADDHLDEEERAELLETLNSLTGTKSELGEDLKSSTLPLCDPAPDIQFSDEAFVFTGTFACGKRRDCEALIRSLGGTVSSSVTGKTSYLVIGTYVTDSWKHSSFGNKILRAVKLRDEGAKIRIVSEAHWQEKLASVAG